MKALIFWVIVLAAGVWIVDSSGCGYNKWTPVGTQEEALRILSYAPIQVYIHTDKGDGMISDFAGCSDLIKALSQRKKAQRYSILSRKLPEKDTKPTNYIALRFNGHNGFQKWLQWSDPFLEFGPECADYIKDAVWRSPAPQGFQTPEEPDYTKLKL